jgi:hypothetical protein
MISSRTFSIAALICIVFSVYGKCIVMVTVVFQSSANNNAVINYIMKRTQCINGDN